MSAPCPTTPTLRLLLLAAVALLATACARSDGAFSRERVGDAAKGYFHGPQEVVYYEVASSGLLRDTAVTWLSRLGITTASERGLVRALARSAGGPLRLVISGPVPVKTAQIVQSALEGLRVRDPKRIEILVVGPESQRLALDRIGSAAGVRLHFVSFREAAGRGEGSSGASLE